MAIQHLDIERLLVQTKSPSVAMVSASRESSLIQAAEGRPRCVVDTKSELCLGIQAYIQALNPRHIQKTMGDVMNRCPESASRIAEESDTLS